MEVDSLKAQVASLTAQLSDEKASKASALSALETKIASLQAIADVHSTACASDKANISTLEAKLAQTSTV